MVYNQSVNATSTLDKRRPEFRDELGYIAPPNRKLPPVPGSNYNTCDRIKRGTLKGVVCHCMPSNLMCSIFNLFPLLSLTTRFRMLPPQCACYFKFAVCTLLGPHYRSHSTWDPRRHLYEELNNRQGSHETIHTHRGKLYIQVFFVFTNNSCFCCILCFVYSIPQLTLS